MCIEVSRKYEKRVKTLKKALFEFLMQTSIIVVLMQL